jgi:hypothetical protein
MQFYSFSIIESILEELLEVGVANQEVFPELYHFSHQNFQLGPWKARHFIPEQVQELVRAQVRIQLKFSGNLEHCCLTI